MISRTELRKAFGNKPFVTKKEVRDAMGYANYSEIRRYFNGLGRIGSKYLTDDVIDKILASIAYEN